MSAHPYEAAGDQDNTALPGLRCDLFYLYPQLISSMGPWTHKRFFHNACHTSAKLPFHMFWWRNGLWRRWSKAVLWLTTLSVPVKSTAADILSSCNCIQHVLLCWESGGQYSVPFYHSQQIHGGGCHHAESLGNISSEAGIRSGQMWITGNSRTNQKLAATDGLQSSAFHLLADISATFRAAAPLLYWEDEGRWDKNWGLQHPLNYCHCLSSGSRTLTNSNLYPWSQSPILSGSLSWRPKT